MKSIIDYHEMSSGPKDDDDKYCVKNACFVSHTSIILIDKYDIYDVQY